MEVRTCLLPVWPGSFLQVFKWPPWPKTKCYTNIPESRKPSKKMGLLSGLVAPSSSNWSYLLELRNKEEKEISVCANSLFLIFNAKTNGFLQVPFVFYYAWGKWGWVLVKDNSVLRLWLVASKMCIFRPGNCSTTFSLTPPPVHWINDISGATKNEMKSVLWYAAGLSWQ